MSHKYLDQLKIEEISYIHRTFVNHGEFVTRTHITDFYEDLFLVETSTYSRISHAVYIYNDFSINKWDERPYHGCPEIDGRITGYRNWMTQRFGIPYVLDLAKAVLDINVPEIKKPAPAKTNKPANRLKQLLKGATDGKKQITRNDPELL